MGGTEAGDGTKEAGAGGLLTEGDGSGPLLERDYWAVIAGCRMPPSAVLQLIARHFESFAPPEIASFRRRGPRDRSLREGDELEVKIAGAGTFAVRVVRLEPQTLTVATLAGHPEAGRITFGAYRNRRGDVLFHIRSRARSSSRLRLVGFLTVGDAMQTRTWTDFIDRVAAAVGRGVVGWIHAEKRRSDDAPAAAMLEPTYIAEGD